MHSLEEIREVRLSGDYSKALDMLRISMKPQQIALPYQLELAKLAVLNGHLPIALRGYRALAPNLEHFSDEDLAPFFRLQTQIPTQDFSALNQWVLKRGSPWSWYTEYQVEGVDSVTVPIIKNHQTRTSTIALFIFDLECSCCGAHMSRCIQQSFCVVDQYSCPTCFAQCETDSDQLLDYWNSFLSGESTEVLDIAAKCNALNRMFNMEPEGSQYSRAERYLSDTYQRMICSMVLKALKRQGA